MMVVGRTISKQNSIVGSLKTRPRERPDQRHRSNRATDYSQHRGSPYLILGRQPGEQVLDQVDIVLNPVEVAANLIGLAQR
jgi:hypothetical protein